MNKKTPRCIAPTGLLLSALALLASTLLGFGGFSLQGFSGYVITAHVSKLQMVFLFLAGLGLMLSGVAYANQAKKQKIKKPNFILLLHLALSMVFFTAAILGLTSQFRDTDLWAQTTFEGIQATLLFNNLTLVSFLVLGTLQVILSIIFCKTKMLQQHHLLKAAKTLALISGILLITKAIIDYPLIKESLFILSYTLKIPFPNNILNIVAPLVYVFAQISIAIIFLQNQQPPSNR